MGNLVLDSLEIRNFRGFRHLQIERLGRVNLIVGKNSVGKTALLEALRLYADRGDPSTIRELLHARGEDRIFSSRLLGGREGVDSVIKYLFYGRPDIGEHIDSIRIGAMDLPSEILMIGNDKDEELSRYPGPTIIVSANNNPNGAHPSTMSYSVLHPEIKKIPHAFVPASGMTEGSISELWDIIALTDREDDVIKALQLITPQVKRIGLIGGQPPNDQRLPIAQLTGMDQPLPLGSLGEGLNRMLGLALVSVNSDDGLLLVDEIESGLHYSVQADMWRLIFETARRLNVQVFATTHSWDCIEAFQEAATADKQEEGMLIRLEERKGDIRAVLASERDLEIITREQIEVR